jgi:transcriptional regulator with XRE-family HTH domain
MPDALPTFSQLLRAGNRFTDRDFMRALGIGHVALKQREADPSLLTVRELLLLSKLLGQPKQKLVKIVWAEAARNSRLAAQLTQAAEQVVGRKNFPRTPAAEEGLS